LAAFSVSLYYTQSVGLLGWGISPSQGLYLHTEQYKHNTDIQALSGIRTHDRRVRSGEDGSCLRPRGYCDRLYIMRNYTTHTPLWKYLGNTSIAPEPFPFISFPVHLPFNHSTEYSVAINSVVKYPTADISRNANTLTEFRCKRREMFREYA
jgi:hypothetical protein